MTAGVPSWRGLGRLTRSPLARGTAWTLLSQGVRMGSQMAYFLILARTLGPEGLGSFAAVLAVAAWVAPFSGIGAGTVMVMHTARDPTAFSQYFGNALWMICFTAPALVGAAALGSVLILEHLSVALIFGVAIAEIVAARLAEVVAQAFQAFERFGEAAAMTAAPYLFRLAAVLGFATMSPDANVAEWALWYAAASVVAAVVAVGVARVRLGPPRRNLGLVVASLREGVLFSTGAASMSVHTDADKALVARIAGSATAGVYTAGYRLVSLVFIPITALLYATYARFFRHGASGTGASLRFALRLLPPASAYGLLAGLLIFLAADFVANVLGQGFGESADVIRALAFLPLLQVLIYLAADSLTSSGRQGLRTAVQLVCGAMNVALNLILIPSYGWAGAAVATMISAGVMAAALWVAAVTLSRRETAQGAAWQAS